MKIYDPRHPWSRLTAAARSMPAGDKAAAPYGFSTRVAALALGTETRRTSPYERFALRAMGLAGLLAVLSVAANIPALGTTPEGTDAVLEDYDPVAVLMGGDV